MDRGELSGVPFSAAARMAVPSEWKQGARRLACMLSLFAWTAGIPLGAREWRELPLSDNKGSPRTAATSRLEEGEDWLKYDPSMAFDGSADTAWVEGVEGDGVGEELWFEVEEGLDRISIVNGFARSQNLFLLNNRVKVLEVRLWAGVNAPGMVTEIAAVYKSCPASAAFTIDLKDTREAQSFQLAIDWKSADAAMEVVVDSVEGLDRCAYILCMTIKEVYRGSKYRDTCISEVAWTVSPEYAGPGGLHRLDMEGSWSTEDSPDWDRLELVWFPFSRMWTVFANETPFDAGSWTLGGGKLVLSSDGTGRVYVGAVTPDGRLVLTEDTGTNILLRKD